MELHGQLGLFAANSTESSPALKKSSVGKKQDLQIIFSQEPSLEDWQNTITSFKERLKKLQGSLINLSLEQQKSWFERSFLALDVETTGLDAASCRVIELGLVPFNAPHLQGMSQLFSINQALPKEIISITGITDDMLENQPQFHEKAEELLNQINQVDFIVAYNAKFDRPFIESELARIDMSLPDVPWIDPYIFIGELDRYKKGKKLIDAAQRWGISLENAHRAFDDAKAAGELLIKIGEKISATTLLELSHQQKIFSWKQAHSMAEYKKANAWSTNR